MSLSLLAELVDKWIADKMEELRVFTEKEGEAEKKAAAEARQAAKSKGAAMKF